MIHRGTYDGTIYHNPVNKFCIISVKTADKEVPQEARSTRRYRDHLIRFVATGYELPRTDAVELELDGEWTKGKYGVQLQVEQWREIVPKTKDGVEGYLASGLIKGIGPATAAQIVSRFGVETLDILQNHPERLLEVKGITESKLEDIKTSYAESRIVVTGKVEPYTRDEMNSLIASLGAVAGSSVTRKTDYLVCGEKAGSKLSKARELDIPVLTPEEFFRMAGVA